MHRIWCTPSAARASSICPDASHASCQGRAIVYSLAVDPVYKIVYIFGIEYPKIMEKSVLETHRFWDRVCGCFLAPVLFSLGAILATAFWSDNVGGFPP